MFSESYSSFLTRFVGAVENIDLDYQVWSNDNAK